MLGLLSCGSAKTPAVRETGQEPSLTRYLPSAQDLAGTWKADDSARVYRDRELYAYIDGGADLYLEYGFREVAVRQYSAPGGLPVIVNLYRMDSPEGAFGIFSATRRPDYQPADIGDRGARTDYLQIFQKGEYYIEVQAQAWNDSAAGYLENLCRVLERKLPESAGSLPAVVSLLPRDNLLPQSLVLVRGPLGLNSRYYLSAENLFALSARVPGVLGLVRGRGPDSSTSLVLAVDYADSAVAAGVLAGLAGFYQARKATGRRVSGGGVDSCCFGGLWGEARLARKGTCLYAAFRPAH